MPVVCVLYDIPKNNKFPVWNDFQFYLTAREADRYKETFLFLCGLCACTIGMRIRTICQIQSQRTAELQVCVLIHVLIRALQCSKYEIEI